MLGTFVVRVAAQAGYYLSLKILEFYSLKINNI
jgi:hypothetical protein